MDTKRKIALITGGSRGLGKDMALNLAKKKNDVIITYHSRKSEADAVAKEIEKSGQRGAAIQLDAGNVKSFDAFFATLKKVLKDVFEADGFDFLINNAGIGIHASLAESTEEQFDSLVNIHFKGVFFITQKALSILRDGGRIINISSGLARFSYSGYSAYASMKGAVETLSRYMAVELGPRQIAVNVVAPGAIATDFAGGLVRDNSDVSNNIASLTALGRVGRADDIGSVVAFLCTDDAKWINGQRIEVSGGIHL